MGQELKGDATMDAMAHAARLRRFFGMDPRFDRPEPLEQWVSFVKGHPRPMDGDTAKNEEGDDGRE